MLNHKFSKWFVFNLYTRVPTLLSKVTWFKKNLVNVLWCMMIQSPLMYIIRLRKTFIPKNCSFLKNKIQINKKSYEHQPRLFPRLEYAKSLKNWLFLNCCYIPRQRMLVFRLGLDNLDSRTCNTGLFWLWKGCSIE